jgi:hypothetical protein
VNTEIPANLIPEGEIQGEDEDETQQLNALLAEARTFISKFEWCMQINDVHLGFGCADIVGVFLFQIVPSRGDIDSVLWVVVGDIPPAYLVLDCAPNAHSALDLYIKEMREWVNAVRVGASLEGIIPVNVQPTLENARSLDARLQFLAKNFL